MITRSIIAATLAVLALVGLAQPASACGSHGPRYYRTLAPHTATPLPDAHRCAHPTGAYADDQWCLTRGPWRPVSQPMADALAEGSAPRATTRRWERCFTHRFGPEKIVACPMGYVELW